MIAGTQVGTYKLVSQIGEGGMGVVWLAEHTMLGRRAAIKLLHPSYTAREDVVQRFFNEARAATAIADSGIVQIFDFGFHTDGSAYIVMELLEGETLHARLEHGPFVIADALRILRQIATSLGAAHARGIIHRDIKPENIFLVRDPEVIGGERPKILDFGIAKLTGENTLKTSASAVIGTPAYMSPEQCRGAGLVDQRSDIYSLGCVLFALISGRPPFVAAGGGELIAAHLMSPPPPLGSIVAGVPREVEAVVARCLEKDPDHRFPSGLELARVLGGLLGTGTPAATTSPSLSVRATPVAGVPQIASTEIAAMGAAPTTLSSASGVHQAQRGRSRTWIYVAATVVGVAGGALAIMAIMSSSSPAAPTPAAAPAPTAMVVEKPPPPPAPAPDPRAALGATMSDALGKFVAWGRDHAGAPCPDAAAIGAGNDPWGHPLRITCTEQPGNQIAGAISAGPDGGFDTGDDIASWQLANALVAVVHGPHWVVAAPKPKPHPHAPAPGLKLDENGIPITR